MRSFEGSIMLQDLYKLHVFCAQLIQFVSDMGGVAGLWFGFALLAFFEFLEFFIDLSVLHIRRRGLRKADAADEKLED